MLPLLKFKEIGEFFKERIEGIHSFVYGAEDEDIKRKLDQLDLEQYPVLVGIIPSSDSSSENIDRHEHRELLFYYVLVPITDRTYEEEEEAWVETQKAIQRVEYLALTSYEEIPSLRRVIANTFHFDPEFGIWNKMGYSVHFQMENSYIAE